MNKLSIGRFPEGWARKTLVYIEPHYDDFLLNAYGILKGMKARNADNKPGKLVVVTMSHSPVNYQNGLRAILNKYSTMNIQLMELGLPDFINDKKNRQTFLSMYEKDVEEADVVDLKSYYRMANPFHNMDKAVEYLTSYAFENPIYLLPIAESYSHPFHRLVTDVVSSMLGINLVWFYRDNPYSFRNGDDDYKTYKGFYYELSPNDLAMRYSLFVNNYEHQVQAQVVWYDSWMLKENTEAFYSTGG